MNPTPAQVIALRGAAVVMAPLIAVATGCTLAWKMATKRPLTTLSGFLVAFLTAGTVLR